MSSDDELRERAAAHGLQLDARSLRHNDAGLDFRVTYAVDVHGREWVLRVPRRPDVRRAVRQEQAILALASRYLDVAVPDWRIAAPDPIASPLLPGRPGLLTDGDDLPSYPAPGSLPHAAHPARAT